MGVVDRDGVHKRLRSVTDGGIGRVNPSPATSANSGISERSSEEEELDNQPLGIKSKVRSPRPSPRRPAASVIERVGQGGGVQSRHGGKKSAAADGAGGRVRGVDSVNGGGGGSGLSSGGEGRTVRLGSSSRTRYDSLSSEVDSGCEGDAVVAMKLSGLLGEAGGWKGGENDAGDGGGSLSLAGVNAMSEKSSSVWKKRGRPRSGSLNDTLALDGDQEGKRKG
ncbi:unnamed protein product, partial [Choristocarpus tenellus]